MDKVKTIGVCTICGEHHDDLKSAEACCSTVDELYECVKCNTIHVYYEEAILCCTSKETKYYFRDGDKIVKAYICDLCDEFIGDKSDADCCCEIPKYGRVGYKDY